MTNNTTKTNWYKSHKTLIWLLTGVILLLFASVYFFTRQVFNDAFNLSETGQIGDTIGGITNPIIGLFGAVLVYLSFRQQLLANKIQREALREEIKSRKLEATSNILSELFKQLREEYASISFEHESVKYHGRSALSIFSNVFPQKINDKEFQKEPIFADIMYLLITAKLLDQKIKNSELDEATKYLISTQSILFFNSKFYSYIENITSCKLDNEHPQSGFLEFCRRELMFYWEIKNQQNIRAFENERRMREEEMRKMKEEEEAKAKAKEKRLADAAQKAKEEEDAKIKAEEEAMRQKENKNENGNS